MNNNRLTETDHINQTNKKKGIMMKKKIIGILAAVIAAVTFAGCSAQAEPAAGVSAAPEETAAATPGGTEAAAPEGTEGNAALEYDGEVLAGESIFGKVKSIVGNEIELELANPPFEMGAPGEGGAAGADVKQRAVTITEGDDGGVQVSEAEAGEVPKGAVRDEQSATYAVTTEGGQVHIVGGEDGEKMELEYTGESKSVIIPAGVSITSMVGEATIDAVKKGSVLMLMVDAKTGTATSVMIME